MTTPSVTLSVANGGTVACDAGVLEGTAHIRLPPGARAHSLVVELVCDSWVEVSEPTNVFCDRG